MNKEEYMSLALKEAFKAKKIDEVPVGCIIVKNDKVLARAYNQKIRKKDPTSHAEIECIKKACNKLKSYYLDDCDMYITLEPCMMCTGAIIQSRLRKIYIGTKDPKGGSVVSSIELSTVKNINHYPEIEIGILQEECSKILKDFFKEKRNKV